MLLNVKGLGIYGQTLVPERLADEMGGPLEVAKAVWGQGILRVRPGRLQTEDDLNIIHSSGDLELARARFQGHGDFQFPVGERIRIGVDKFPEIAEQLLQSGVTRESVGHLGKLFENKHRVEEGFLPFHVVHVAGEEGSDPYASRRNAYRICCSVLNSRPYYELIPKPEPEGFGFLVFMPKQLLEDTAELYPQPQALLVESVLAHPWATPL